MHKRILIVEDDTGLCDMLTMQLQSAGYVVMTAPNGVEGLRMAMAEMPDLIITDVLMPVMDGFKFFKKLKSNKYTAVIPVIILTARGQMRDTFKIYQADAFLEKPSETSLLLQKVEQCLRQPTKSRDGKSLLLAGTNARIVETMDDILTHYGCRTQCLTSGPEIMVQAVLFKPDIIIMDIQMEGTVSSAQIIRSVRLLPHCQTIPILTYSYIDAEKVGLYEFHVKAAMIQTHQERCRRAGATEYIGAFNEASFREKIAPFLTFEVTH